ncbi:hypothetical protein V8B97DRAFT_1916791 [Scleroderma yunnanense]
MALEQAVLMKQAGHETRQFQALAIAWELKEIEHYGKLVQELHQTDYEEYKEYKEAMADKKDHVDLEGSELLMEEIDRVDLPNIRDNVASITAYKHKTYNKETLSFDTTETQLNQLKEEVKDCLALKLCSSPHEADDSPDCDSNDEYTGGEGDINGDEGRVAQITG